MNPIKRKLIKAIRRPDLAARYMFNFLRWSRPMERLQTPAGVFYTDRNMHFSDRASLHNGGYEIDEIRLLKNFQQADVIIEIGANIGYVARHAFANLKPGGLYVCVEPNPAVLEALSKNMRETVKRNPGKHFEIVAAAVCDQEGFTEFTARSNLGSSLTKYNGEKGKNDQPMRIAAITLQTLVRRYERPTRGGKTMSLICDAEGAEIDMMRSGAAYFAAFQNIAIELHPRKIEDREVTVPDMINMFKALRFDLVEARRNNTCCLFTRMPQRTLE